MEDKYDFEGVIITPFHTNTGLPIECYDTFKANSWFSIIPASDYYLRGKIPAKIADPYPGYRKFLLEDAMEHYRHVQHKWYERDRERVFSIVRLRQLDPWDGSGRDPYGEEPKKGMSREAIETELSVYEMFLEFLAGERDRLSFPGYLAPNLPYEEYYISVAEDFVSGAISDAFGLDKQLFTICKEFAYWDYCYTETDFVPTLPTNDDDDEEVFSMDQ